ncbi:MAG TPA: mechanosensitive ion channel domain-containing protein [Candidatus Acidoferrales bacterium]|nr:mechanosensitive ion channel domain-containing protein [Candidatus Acidoferrales bacterium]
MVVSLVVLAVQVIVAVGILWVIGEFIIRGIINPAARRAGVEQGQLHIFIEGIRFIVIVLSALAVIRIAGLTSDFATLTVSGILAVSISLALQATLSNVFSGILLILDNTLRVNDSIEIGGTKGQVVKIGLRTSWVKTEEGSVVIISNSQIANGPLTNHTASERLMKKL